jgi:hypothetical protein
MSCVGTSEASLFRSIEMWTPAIIVDEADTILIDNEPLRAVVNSGYTRGSGVPRCIGDNNTPHLFPTFCPKALGMKGRKLPDTTLSRCVIIEMRRKKRTERAEHFKHIDDAGLCELRSQCMRWAIDAVEVLKVAKPQMPNGFDNRAGDNWSLMLAIADYAGGEWPEKARQAALAVSKVVAAADASTGVKLLADIRTVFEAKGVDRLPSSELASTLGAMEDRPWSEWKGKPITQAALAKLLNPFEIIPDGIRVGGSTPRGYYLAQFQDAFERYLSEPHDDDEASGPDGPAMHAPLDRDEEHQIRGRCVQCNGPEADAPLVTGEGYPPDGVHLHEQCRAFWLQHNRVGREQSLRSFERFRKVAEMPPGTYCVHCHNSDRQVFRIRDAHAGAGSKTEPLHENCAPRFFR